MIARTSVQTGKDQSKAVAGDSQGDRVSNWLHTFVIREEDIKARGRWLAG